jgi:hypothetical protein
VSNNPPAATTTASKQKRRAWCSIGLVPNWIIHVLRSTAAATPSIGRSASTFDRIVPLFDEPVVLPGEVFALLIVHASLYLARAFELIDLTPQPLDLSTILLHLSSVLLDPA